jgi:hypothetical protein
MGKLFAPWTTAVQNQALINQLAFGSRKMSRPGIVYCFVCITLLGLVGNAAAADKEKPFPKGSEKAVAAVREAVPKAEIDEVLEPKGFGGSGGKGTPLFWSIRYHVGEHKQDLSVTPEGAIIRLPTPVEPKDLPKPVADAVAKAEPKATIKSAERNEMRATMKYVAMEKAQVLQYAIDVVKDGKRSRITMNGDGGSPKVTDSKEGAKKKDESAAKPKEIDIPEKAVKAVKAIKGLYPEATVIQITTEVFDDGTGDIEILTYEIEFIHNGTKREMVASPEGVIPHLWASIEAKDLPKPVTEALAKAAPDAKVEKARAHEVRASFRFGPLEKPKVYYTVRIDKEGKESTLKFKPNGTFIKDFRFPQKK